MSHLARIVALLLLFASAACKSPMDERPRDIRPRWRPQASASERRAAEVEPTGFRAREGAFLSAAAHVWGLMGDYEGDGVLQGPNGDFVIVPEYDPTTGPQVGLGYRGERFGFELSYKRIESEGDFLGFVEDDLWQYLDLDFREYFFLDSRLQPYLTLGLGYFFGTIVEGATDGVVIRDSDFSGVSVQGGGGLALYLSERLALDARALYRYAETLDVENVAGDTVSIDDGLSANAWGLTIGLSYTF